MHGGGDAAGAESLYDLLEVPAQASQEEIRKAYRRLALRHHPDRGGDAERFKGIAGAHEVLGDPQSRRQYDLRRQAGSHNRWTTVPGAGNYSHHNFSPRWSPPRAAPPVSRRTEDLVLDMEVTLEQLYSGAVQRMSVDRDVIDQESPPSPCLGCSGLGFIGLLGSCHLCRGAGSCARTKRERRAFEVPVERGAPEGHRVVFHGQADERPGCHSGDLVFVLRVQGHREFVRQQADLYVERTITLLEALSGFSVDITHLSGRVMRLKTRPSEVTRPHVNQGLSEAAWDCFEATGLQLDEPAQSIEWPGVVECQQLCESRDYGGFVCSGGRALFFRGPRAQLLERRRPCEESTLRVRPDPERALQLRMRKAARGAGMPYWGNPSACGNLFLLLTIAFPKEVGPACALLLREALPACGSSADPDASAGGGDDGSGSGADGMRRLHLEDPAPDSLGPVDRGDEPMTCHQQ